MNEPMSFMDAIKSVFSKFADFNGRARRSEFWWWYLFCGIVNTVFYLPISFMMSKKEALLNDALSGKITLAEADAADPTTTLIIFAIIMCLVSLTLLIPSLAVMCRRLHDVDKSGHMMWLYLVCGVGGLIPLIMCIPDGTPGPNKYGPSPKGIAGQAPLMPGQPRPMPPMHQ